MTPQEEALEIYQELANNYNYKKNHNTPENNYNMEPSDAEIQQDRLLIESIHKRVTERPELLSCILDNKDSLLGFIDAAPLFFFLSRWRIYISYELSQSYAKKEYEWFLGTRFVESSYFAEYRPRFAHYNHVIKDFFFDNNMLLQDFVDVDELVDAIKKQTPDYEELLLELTKKITDENFKYVKLSEDDFEHEIDGEKFILDNRQRIADFLNKMRLESEYLARPVNFGISRGIATVRGYEALQLPINELKANAERASASKGAGHHKRHQMG